jgi:hypothetical protein
MTVKIESDTPIQDIDSEKCGKILEDLITAFNHQSISNKEIVLVLSNLMYTLGAYIEGYKEKGPGIDALEKLYYSHPTAGVGLMLQSLLMSTWLDSMPKENKEK